MESVRRTLNRDGRKSLRRINHVHKDVFCENYATLLAQILGKDAAGLDPVDEESMRTPEGKGIDLTFQNLSLVVKVGAKEVNVVNNVTGRVASSSMTALIGGR